MPGLVDEWVWSQKQGDDATFTATYQEDDGSGIDLTGASVELSIAKDRRKTPAWTFTDAPEVEISDPENGVVSVHLSAEQTRAWGKLTSLVYEITVTLSDGERITILEGPISVRLEVANDE